MDFGISLDASSVSHRHCLEDSEEEEEDDDIEIEQTQIFTSPEVARSGANLIIALGQSAAIFIKSYLNLEPVPFYRVETNSHMVFKDKHFSTNTEGQTTVVSEGFEVGCKSENEKFFACCHEQQLNSQHCTPWCAKVIDIFQPERVLILTSRKSHEYLSSHPRESGAGVPPHTLRAVQSSDWLLDPVARSLEPPNTIIGEPAAVLTHCQLRALPAALLVCYSESSQSGSECVAALRPILGHPLIKNHLTVNSQQEALQRTKKLLPRQREDMNHLYT